jgi:hypothetical protein
MKLSYYFAFALEDGVTQILFQDLIKKTQIVFGF